MWVELGIYDTLLTVFQLVKINSRTNNWVKSVRAEVSEVMVYQYFSHYKRTFFLNFK